MSDSQESCRYNSQFCVRLWPAASYNPLPQSNLFDKTFFHDGVEIGSRARRAFMKAIRIHKCGGPEALLYEELALPEPKPGEARVRIEAIGLNYVDIYQRSGLYPLQTPFTLGMEAAGVVDAVGAGVSDVKPGERVAYAMVPGSYAEYATVPAWRLAPLPANVNAQAAATLMLQGMTAHYLAHSTYNLKQGETALVHAAAGGVGLLLIQIAKMRGARVIGTVSTEAKAQLAKDAGADHVIL